MSPSTSKLGRAIFCLSALAGLASGAAIQRRDEIDSDAVVGFPETVPANATGELYLKYKPWLKVVNGCVPFPAVDEAGNTNAGLNPSGDSSGDCDSSTGQVYVRGTTYNSQYAIMYSWYMPKDEPSNGIGHRHDWEGAVVWLSSADATGELLGIAASGHGGFQTSTSPTLDGSRPLIRYYSNWPLDHQLGFTDEKGGEQPLVAWESLPEAARTALENTDFDKANVPFKDANFEANLEKAAL
ncbi:uncharacterized protein K452DRAFT_237706 [Aplosporella prunicola CBS 121167]|uniref:Uncharacterized protein n=1 Tax=Aplosporella prunicola CBS 121167 TaxID=1176127 RepID=A0A6A6AZ84_9PEZI|nr:uncharacterized protein K452DRAFT_237706 [Aplosporella prunicola CBS 121167]KAF2136314.1 hypothetical protein K452DRAFT_237706 [Aplosporella prunicola CBS 121167]